MQSTFENLAKLKLLLSVDRIGPSRILKLLSKFETLENLFDASVRDIESTQLINKHLSRSIHDSFNKLSETEQQFDIELKQLQKLGCRIITYWAEEYPENLRKIYLPPIFLYIKGKIVQTDIDSLSIVGTRGPSEYGKLQAEKFSAELSEKGLTIVSGMARGIDSIAHRAALEAKGRTLAVIGSGIDVIYPPENRKLFETISENGAVISEFELGTKPDAPNFPRRNRIISGISLGTLIIETRRIGGAMQTASHALDQNREVFAVPGNISSKQSEGTNLLIQRAEAKLVMEARDVIDELNLTFKKTFAKKHIKNEYSLNLFEQSIINVLSGKPKHIDNIADDSNISSADCLVYLLNLELKGIVKQLPGKNFILA